MGEQPMSTVEPPRIVLDTNVLVRALGPASPFRGLYDAFRRARFTLCVSTAVLFEYEEMARRMASPSAAARLLRELHALPNVRAVEPAFRWRRTPTDPDDDKFVDLAITAGADALVTEDRHLDPAALARGFPPVRVLRAADFQRWLDA